MNLEISALEKIQDIFQIKDLLKLIILIEFDYVYFEEIKIIFTEIFSCRKMKPELKNCI